MIDFRDRVNRVLNHAKSNFGEWATLYPAAGGSFPIKGIFDNETVNIDPDTEQLFSDNQPSFGVNLFDLDIEIRTNDKIKIRNLTFIIYDRRDDGQGGSTLMLQKVNHDQKVYKKKDY